ncbi:MAG: hypothetical protein A2007_01720 [Verrucomicrobia bacterium GWC2_42_7]|nr:MAG: hypothetical protein A2007_01720 [Verrucomicrobia bacterium GWC2_42_7]
MKKIILLASALTLMIPTTQAAYKSGFYVGVNAGGSYDYNKVDETDVASVPPVSISRGKKIESGAFQGGLFLGYLFRIPESKLLLGLEHSSSFSSFSKEWRSVDANTIRYDNKLTRNYCGSFVLKFGGVLQEAWLVYGLLGVDISRFKLGTTFSPDIGSPQKGSCRKTLVGICYGLGLEREICEHWRLGFEFRCTQYCSKKMLTNYADVYSDEMDAKLGSIYAGMRLSYAF